MSQEPRKRAGLGRGLSALLGDAPVAAGTEGSVSMLPIASIIADPDQPRRFFDEDALGELAASIAEHGVLQPILVQPNGGQYQIVAGERRWRAAQRAQLHEIPAVVRSFEQGSALEAAIVENIQRQDLNAIEEAQAYNRLIVEFSYTQERLGRQVHKSRSHIANLLRLLELPPEVQQSVSNGALSMGHARAIVGMADPAAAADEVIRKGLSVRDTERLAKAGRPTPKPALDTAPRQDADVEALQRHLRDLLGMDVRIAHSGRSGTVTLTYASLEQLDMICQRLSGDRI